MKKINRRMFLSTMGMGVAAIALSACGATPTPTPLPTATKVPPTAVPPTAVPPAATKAPAAATAAPAAPTAASAAPTAAPTAAAATGPKRPNGDTGSPEWLLDGSGGIALPIVKDKLNITYWVGLGGNPGASMKSFNEMACYIEQEKRTNIHLDFQHPAIGQETEAFNLMLVSRKFPDVIEANWISETLYPGGPAKAIKDGVILKINDLVNQYAPNFKNCLAKNPDWRKQFVTDDGDIYGFPFFRGDPRLLIFVGPTVREDWMKKLNIATPETIDDWHNMLVAFKTKDPNGNGKADEIPFTPSWGQNDSMRFAWTNGAFVAAYGTGMGFFQVNNVVKFGPVQPEFKAFLKDMAAWFKEGLIDLDWVNMDTKLRDAKITGSQLGSWVAYTGSGIGYFAGLMAGKEPATFKQVGTPYPVMKKGDPVHLSQKDPNSPGGNTAAITTACKNVKEVMQLLDYAFSYEGHILYNFGVEGVSFNWVNGFPKYMDVVVKNPQYPLAVAMARYFRSNFAGPFVQDYRYFTQYLTLPEQLTAVDVWSKPVNDWWMPPITPNADESKQFNKVMTDVNTLFAEQFAKTITGDVPVDNWDKTVAQFKQFGMDDAVKLRQAALDRYNKR